MHLGETILVTGSGGFIGRAVAKALSETTFNVRAGYRRAVPSDVSAGVLCDLDQPDQIAAAVKGADVVIHCAFADEHAMVRQCQSLLDAMALASVTKIIYFSSIAVHGEGQGPIGFYAEQKARCEQLILQWCEKSPEHRAVILRPGIVYGAGSHLWIDKLVARIRAGVWGDFGAAADGPATLIHIDDLSIVTREAANYLLSDKHAPISLDVVGPEVPSWNAYFQALAARVSHHPLRNISPLGRTILLIVGIAAKVLRRLGLPIMRGAALAPTKGELVMFARNVPYDAAEVPKHLGFQPQIGLVEGLARSLPNQDTRPAP
jgi:nucleoside-diphosphate-sugar epimerase